MNDTVKAIVAILEGGRPELQVAAAQILGELRAKDPAVVRALAAISARSSVVGRYAIEALAHIGTPEALAVVVTQLCENEMLADQAMHLLAEAGRSAHPAIAAAFDEALADKRLRLLQVLARAPSKECIKPFVQALATAETTEAAARILIEHADQFRSALARPLRDALGNALEEPLPDGAVAAVLEVLAALDPGAAKAVLVKHAGDKYTLAVRTAALRGLRGQNLTALQVKGFVAQLEDSDQQPLHQALRELLSELPAWPPGLGQVLKRLLASRNPEQRLFALRAMRGSASPELVKQALKLRDHDDPRFRAAAEELLANSKQAAEPLLRALQTCRDPIEGRALAALLVRLGPQIPPRQVRVIAERAIKVLAGRGPSGDMLCDVAIAIGGPKLVPFFLERAVRWRRSKRFPEALHLFAKLAAARLLDNEGLYQLAVARFLQDVHRPAMDGSAPGNAAMGFFTGLLRDGFPLIDRLRKDTSVPPELQLRLATYFADAVGTERRFGTELLQLLASRHKGRTGDEARNALRTVGL